MKINFQLLITVVWFLILLTQFGLMPSIVGVIVYIALNEALGNKIIKKEKDKKSLEELQKEHQLKAEEVIKFSTNNAYNKHSNKRYATKAKRLKK